jgi:acyl carrier protein
MTVNATQLVHSLSELPPSDRRDALTAIVLREFRAVLLMPDDEDLPVDESYFELGFTSLRLTEVKERLEDRLGCRISTTLLFNSPTATALVDHLISVEFPEIFESAASAAGPDAPAPAWGGVLDDLLRS